MAPLTAHVQWRAGERVRVSMHDGMCLHVPEEESERHVTEPCERSRSAAAEAGAPLHSLPRHSRGRLKIHGLAQEQAKTALRTRKLFLVHCRARAFPDSRVSRSCAASLARVWQPRR